jgi:phosphatidate phosphatase APP1
VFQLKGTNSNWESFAGTDADPVLFVSAPLKSGDVLSTGIFQKDRTNVPKDSAAPLVQVAVTLGDFSKLSVDTVNASTDPYGLHVVKARIVPADIGGMNFTLTTDVIKKAKMLDVTVDAGAITAAP